MLSPGIKYLNDVREIEKVPLDDRRLPPSTYRMIEEGAAVDPDNAALRFFFKGDAFGSSVSYTYRDLMGRINQTANMLDALGVEDETVVSIVLPNLPETHFAIWGGKARGVVNPINPLLEPAQMAEIMNAAGTEVLVTLAPFPNTDLWAKVDSIRYRVPTLKTVLRVDIGKYLKGFEKAAVKLLSLKNPRPKRVVGQDVHGFDEWLKRHPARGLSFDRTIAPDDVASLFHTGGTTGAPKLARLTHRNEVFAVWAVAQNRNLSPGQTLFCGLPLFHVNGVLVTGLLPWGTGATVVLGTPQGYRGEGVLRNFWKIVEHYGVNAFSGVPTVYSALLDVPVGESDVSSLEFGICGASPLPTEVFRKFEERTGVEILEGYGLTEGACISSVNPGFGERRTGSVGFALPYQEMKAVALDEEGAHARDCAPGEIGTIVLRGPNVFAGYKGRAHDRAAWVEARDGGARWFNSGDMGRVDRDGYWWLTGRLKELIIRGGHNIDPRSIESVLHGHPAVASAAAVGSPDARLGEVPVAYVQLHPGAAASEEDLLRFAEGSIAERAAVPRRIRVVDRMPLTAVGKVFKPGLVRLEAQEVFSREVGALGGVRRVSVAVGPHEVHGNLASVRVEPEVGVAEAELEGLVGEVLGRYAMPHETTFG